MHWSFFIQLYLMGTGVFIHQKGQKSTKVSYNLCTESSLCVPQMKEVIQDGNVGVRKDDSIVI